MAEQERSDRQPSEQDQEERARKLEEAAREGPVHPPVGSADVAGPEEPAGASYEERDRKEGKEA